MDLHPSTPPTPALQFPLTRQLLAVALSTLVALGATIALHMFHGLNPSLNLGLNLALSVLWAVSFALLAWWASSTLAHACAVDNWESDTGVAVCRMYKALFSFAVLGLVGTLAALGLDVHVQRSSTRKGRFVSLGVVGGKQDGRGRELGGDEGVWDVDASPAATRGARGGEGYAVPEEQFRYADTSYEGAAGQVGRRSVEERL